MNSVTPLVLPKGSFFNGVTPKWSKGSGRAGDRGAPDATRESDPKPSTDQSPVSTQGSDEKTQTTQKSRETTEEKACSTRHAKRGPDDKDDKQPGNYEIEQLSFCPGLQRDCSRSLCVVMFADLSSDQNCGDDNNIRITSIVRSVAKETFVPKTCNHKDNPQACAHYYSAIKDQRLKDTFTCTDEEKPRRIAKTTTTWSKQHNGGTGWKDFHPVSYTYKGQEMKLNCEADEWPPAYFLPDDENEVANPAWSQLIRWIPREDNGGAAQIWTGFCKDHDGGRGNSQRVNPKRRPWTQKGLDDKPEEQLPLSLDLVDPGKKSQVRSNIHDGTTTHTTIYEEVTFTRAVFTMKFDYPPGKEPSQQNDWHLFENACAPLALIP